MIISGAQLLKSVVDLVDCEGKYSLLSLEVERKQRKVIIHIEIVFESLSIILELGEKFN